MEEALEILKEIKASGKAYMYGHNKIVKAIESLEALSKQDSISKISELLLFAKNEPELWQMIKTANKDKIEELKALLS